MELQLWVHQAFLLTLQQHSVPQELKPWAWKSCEGPVALTSASVKKTYTAIPALPLETRFLKSMSVSHAMDSEAVFAIRINEQNTSWLLCLRD